ncbi:MAG: ATP-binding protein [Gemmataceae bacterium]
MTSPDLVPMNLASNHGPVGFTDVTIASDSGEARKVQDEIESLLHARQVTDKEIFSVRLALEEALINAIKHGNQMDRDKKVRISYRFLHDRLEIQITDEGTGFDPNDVPDPTAVENLERPCGRGLMLMRHYMSEVNYNDRGNSVVMAKVFCCCNGK